MPPMQWSSFNQVGMCSDDCMKRTEHQQSQSRLGVPILTYLLLTPPPHPRGNLPIYLPFTTNSYAGDEAQGWKEASAGAAINLHLAANLMLQQISPILAHEEGRGRKAGGGVGPDQAGSSPRTTASRHHTLSSVGPGPTSVSCKESVHGVGLNNFQDQLVVNAVDCALRESVLATEQRDASIVAVVVGSLDADAVRARKESLASAASSLARDLERPADP